MSDERTAEPDPIDAPLDDATAIEAAIRLCQYLYRKQELLEQELVALKTQFRELGDLCLKQQATMKEALCTLALTIAPPRAGSLKN
jgi:hypothetical protein